MMSVANLSKNNISTPKYVITYTFSTCGENHVGNEKIGEMRDGFNSSFFENLMCLHNPNITVHNLATNLPIPQNMEAHIATYSDFCGMNRENIENEARMIYWDEAKWDSDTRTVQFKHARTNTMFCYPETMSNYNGVPKFPDFQAYEDEYKNAITIKEQLERNHMEIIKTITSQVKYEDKVKAKKTLSNEENNIYSQYEIACKKIKAIPHGIEVTKAAIAEIKCKKLEEYILQYPDYLQGKGTVYNINTLPYTHKLAQKVEMFCLENGYVFEKKAYVIEGNYYHDVDQCYIGFHGDTEREVVFGVRLGNSQIPLFYGWWYKNQLIPNSLKCFVPKSGDAYMMARKTVGRDWKSSNAYTLRHAAGDILTLQKQKSLDAIVKKDKFFINRILDPNSSFITYMTEQDKNFALEKLRNLYLLHQKKNNNNKSAEQTLIDKFEADQVTYQKDIN